MRHIDYYAYTSKLRWVNPLQKTLFTFITLCLCLSVNSSLLFIVIIAFMSFLTLWKGKIPCLSYLKLLTIPLTFLSLSLLSIFIEIGLEPQNFIWSFSFAYYLIGFTQHSLHTGVILFLKVLASISCLYFLCLSTPMIDLFIVLEKLKCPTILIDLMSLIYRFIFILMDLTCMMQVAQSSRLGYYNLKSGFKCCGILFSSLLIKALKTNDSIYLALESRGYHQSLHILNDNAYYSISYLKLVSIELGFIFILCLDKFFI